MGLFNIGTLIYIIFAGIIFACIYTYYSGKFLGGFVRKLDENGFNTQDKATTLRGLGYSKITAFLISMSLFEGASLRRYVSAVFSADEMAVCREKGVKQKQRYYILAEKSETAKRRYNGENMKLWKLICSILVCIAVAGVCAKIFPYIVAMVKGA